MVPPKGDFAMLPLNPEARKVADAWDPAKDRAAGKACRSYGAAAIMRVPGRFHIHWVDDNTLQMDTDSGTQTRAVPVWRCAARADRRPSGRATRWRRGKGIQRGRGAKPDRPA